MKPSNRIAQLLDSTIDACRELYNAALQERRDSYRTSGKSISYYDQANQLPEIKAERYDLALIHSQVLQDTLRRVAHTYDAFYERCLKGQMPGFPRFKSKHRYNSFTYPQTGFKLEGNKLSLSKIGSMRLRLSRQIEGHIKTCTIKRQVDGWFVIFTVEESYSPFIPKTGRIVGIDVGIRNFATLSTGEVIDNPRYLRAAERELKIKQRKVSKKKRGGGNRRKAVRILAKKHMKVANQRKDFFHKAANQIIREFDEIAVEELNIAGMVRNHHLAKSISDAAWGRFLLVLTSKAASAGRRVWKVAPQFTSQDCSRCGERVKKSLAIREHRCIGCGLVMDRDHNAAINIRARAERFAREKAVSPVDQRIRFL